MLRISPEEYRRRLRALQADVGQSALDIFVVSSLESVYYLSGAGFELLKRPFFLLVRPDRAPTLLVPRLERGRVRGTICRQRGTPEGCSLR
jgi:Xaa-Pro aminopeptidase